MKRPLTIEEIVYWAALIDYHAASISPCEGLVRLYISGDVAGLAQAELRHWRSARAQRGAYEDWAREHIVAAMLLRQARRIVLERSARQQ